MNYSQTDAHNIYYKLMLDLKYEMLCSQNSNIVKHNYIFK